MRVYIRRAMFRRPRAQRFQLSINCRSWRTRPMEPGNCTAYFLGTTCELWAPTQVPQDCRDSVAQAVGLDPDQVKVNVTLMGGGFGRRLEHDYAVEAALVSKAVRAPVKVLWTREDDMRSSTYRPASLHQLSAVLDGAGWPVAFTHRIIAPSISGQKGQPGPNGIDPDLPDEAAFVYGLPNVSLEYVLVETAVPLGWMRSVYALQAGFASESFIDELAAAAGKDPLEYRLHMLAKESGHSILHDDMAYGANARSAATCGGKGRMGQTACQLDVFAGSPASDVFLLMWRKWWKSAWRTMGREYTALWRQWIAGRL